MKKDTSNAPRTLDSQIYDALLGMQNPPEKCMQMWNADIQILIMVKRFLVFQKTYYNIKVDNSNQTFWNMNHKTFVSKWTKYENWIEKLGLLILMFTL